MSSTLRRQISGDANERGDILIQIAAVLDAFPAAASDAAPTKIRVLAYIEGIGDKPLWAVKEARRRVIAGECSGINLAFAPSPPQFVGVVRDVMAPRLDDLRTLDKLLLVDDTAEPGSEGHSRIVEGFESLKFELRAAQEEKPKTDLFARSNAKFADQTEIGRASRSVEDERETDEKRGGIPAEM
jgi:hypothetical protein